MYKRISKNEFCELLSKNKENWFTYNGASMLYDYLLNWIDDAKYIVDVVDLRCQYSEYWVDEFIKEYDEKFKEYLSENNELIDEETKEEDFLKECEDVLMEGFISYDTSKDIVLIDTYAWKY